MIDIVDRIVNFPWCRDLGFKVVGNYIDDVTDYKKEMADRFSSLWDKRIDLTEVEEELVSKAA